MGKAELERIRRKIGPLLRQSRRERGLSQSDMAQIVELSQSRLSELEGGKGSLGGEELLFLVQEGYLDLYDMIEQREPIDQENLQTRLQKQLRPRQLLQKRLSFQSRQEEMDLMSEVLVCASQASMITDLVNLVVHHGQWLNFDAMAMKLYALGIDGRIWWLVEGSLWAVRHRLRWHLPAHISQIYKRANDLLVIKSKTSNQFFSLRKAAPEDILDGDLIRAELVEKTRVNRDALASRWRMITSITLQDFAQSLEKHEKNL